MSPEDGRAQGSGGEFPDANRLAAASPEEFEERFVTALSGDSGGLTHLHRVLAEAAVWCLTHGVEGGAHRLDHLAGRLFVLGEDLHRAGLDISHEVRAERYAAAPRASPAAAARGISAGPPSEPTTAQPPVAPSRPLPHSR
ncbi:hypothetical protein K373_05973 [Streptomyces sp. DvalAA-21]|nr:protein kinase [Streptomyces sp. SirexAA-E]PZX31441.1 hypothetical protein K373_05973 [Streptomyces sp. DvalAA-21]RAJ28196.1 hypothetical protein K351_05801 [Streptomyces sp. DpondAA-E10]RAJ41911.1 hypothetical protein K352_05792 [Streptomyces sp. DpondAA-A50]SCE00102.1 hypothetical protein GA0115235_110612 [Streptomyces sp. DpondAA-F4a]SCL88206.1 hypothetical protein SAMN04883147_1028108 [Streptomyces sp. DpondAA-F4]